MTDLNADRDQNESGKHVEPDFSKPADASTSEAANTAAEGTAESSPRAAAMPSKEIVLQRLTPHSSWDDAAFGQAKSFSGAAEPAANSRRYLSIAAIVALAAIVGAVGGSAATFGIAHYLSDDNASLAAANQSRVTQGAVAKLNSEIAALKASSTAQTAKIGDRIDRVEKAQAEPAAKLAKLSDAVEKLRASEATGSVTKPVAAATPTPAPVVSRLPIIPGWILRDVADGGATVEGRQGIFEVFAGDPLPGIGRVDAIRRQDGRWVVVTSRGLIVAR